MRLRILTLVLGLMFPVFARAEPAVYDSEVARFKLTTIADGLDHPWSLAFLPDGSYLVTERKGTLLRVRADGTKSDVGGTPRVVSSGQAGLFDVVLDPGFVATRGYIYFSYAGGGRDNNNTEVARGMFDTRGNTISDLKVIFRAAPKTEGTSHYGGRLAFDNDGFLYISLGDRYDHRDEAQNLRSHLGKIIRLNADGTLPDTGNPFRHSVGADPEIFTYGHRNVQGLALQPETGRLWAHEHGPRGGDEVNILKAGANYGWPLTSYGVNYSGTKVSDKAEAQGIESPVLHWTPSIAPSGMAFYSGRAFPAWRGDLFVGALAGTQLWRLDVEGDAIKGQEALLPDFGERVRDVRAGPDGALYFLTDEGNGRLLKLEPAQ